MAPSGRSCLAQVQTSRGLSEGRVLIPPLRGHWKPHEVLGPGGDEMLGEGRVTDSGGSSGVPNSPVPGVQR